MKLVTVTGVVRGPFHDELTMNLTTWVFLNPITVTARPENTAADRFIVCASDSASHLGVGTEGQLIAGLDGHKANPTRTSGMTVIARMKRRNITSELTRRRDFTNPLPHQS